MAALRIRTRAGATTIHRAPRAEAATSRRSMSGGLGSAGRPCPDMLDRPDDPDMTRPTRTRRPTPGPASPPRTRPGHADGDRRAGLGLPVRARHVIRAADALHARRGAVLDDERGALVDRPAGADEPGRDGVDQPAHGPPLGG